MLRHLRTREEEGDGAVWIIPLNPSDPASWEDDPCTFCGGESFPAVCPGDGRSHHHGAIHPPPSHPHAGYWYLCRSEDCRQKALAAWADERAMQDAAHALNK